MLQTVSLKNAQPILLEKRLPHMIFILDPEETKDIELTVQTLHTAPVCQQLPPLGHKLKRRHKLCCVLWQTNCCSFV